MNSAKNLEIAAGVSVPSALIAWFAETLPVIQWAAGALAIVVSALAIWKHLRK